MKRLLPFAISLLLSTPAWAGYAPGVVLVKFKAGADHARVHTLGGGVEKRALTVPGWVEASLGPGVSVEDALKRYQADPSVEAVQPDYLYKPVGITPNDPLFSSQYGLTKISAPAAWDLERGTTSKVTVAVLDTGIDPTHPDLAAKIDQTDWAVFCPSAGACPNSTCTPCSSGGPACTTPIADSVGHGTMVAGIIGAVTNNSSGMAGVSWGATLVPVKIFDNNSCADSVSLSAALNYVTNMATTKAATVGKVVVNMSVGETPSPVTAAPSCDSASDVVTVAANDAMSSDLVLVAAAGNIEAPDYYQDVQCPARIPGIVASGATDGSDLVASFSAHGTAMAQHGMTAPGVSILSTQPGGVYGSADGTSFSSPHVAGVAALLRSNQPAAGQAQVVAWLFAGADNIGQDPAYQGKGRLDAFRSMRLANNSLAGFQGESKVIAFPNPFHPSLGTLSISVPPKIAGGQLTVKVFDGAGELVRTLRSPNWDGRNEAGSLVASGVYVLLVETANGKGTGRVAVLK